jgi:hypothetical protein
MCLLTQLFCTSQKTNCSHITKNEQNVMCLLTQIFCTSQKTNCRHITNNNHHVMCLLTQLVCTSQKTNCSHITKNDHHVMCLLTQLFCTSQKTNCRHITKNDHLTARDVYCAVRAKCLNPLIPELNPSAQRCLPRFFTGILIFKGSLRDVFISRSALNG